MSMTVNLPDDIVARLAAEAERRGVSVEELVAEAVTARFPAREQPAGRRLSFVGTGSSGGGDNVAERHREIIREHYADTTASDV